MPSDKRQRQDEGRLVRLEEQRVTTQKDQRKRQFRTLGFILGGIIVVAGAIAIFSGDEANDDVSTDTTGATSTTASEPGESASVYGTTPCPAEASPVAAPFDTPFEQCIDPASAYSATFETSAGTVVVELAADTTPGTVNNFVSLARSGYYDGTQLFRTDPSTGIIQGGAPTNSASDPGPGYTIKDEGGPFNYEPGQLVMARSEGPDSAGAQFFFSVTDAVSALEAQGTYVVFGTVTAGLEVLEQVLASHQDQPDNPLGGAPDPAVTITSVTITEG